MPTTYVDEFNPQALLPNKPHLVRAGVRSDPQKLRFDNVKSCIALGVASQGQNVLIGVHFNIANTDAEMDIAFAEIGKKLNGARCNAYLVGLYSNFKKTQLLRKLRKVAERVYLCDVPERKKNEANVDVKMEFTAPGKVYLSIRDHVDFIRDGSGRNVLMAKYPNWNAAAADAKAGMQVYQKDKDSKPWIPVYPVLI